MTIEATILISVVSVSFALYFGLKGMRRNQKKDDAEEASERTTVIVKLENISSGIAEIKSEMCNLRSDLREQRERLVIAEESVKSAHKRIDELRKKEESK